MLYVACVTNLNLSMCLNLFFFYFAAKEQKVLIIEKVHEQDENFQPVLVEGSEVVVELSDNELGKLMYNPKSKYSASYWL